MSEIRSNKFLAHATGISRREADEAIAACRVCINGQVAAMGAPVKDGDVVTLDGEVVSAQKQYTYLLLNKPVGYVCSRKRQGDTPTIYELLPEKYRFLKPVGRLDKDSSGLILLSDDGDFAHRMTHPSYIKTKLYEVTLDRPLEPLHQQMISDHGITLEDGVSKLVVERLTEGVADGRYLITMHEGRNRQIRRTFGALGYLVMKLHRTTFGNYSLGDIKKGEHTLVDIL